MSHFITETYISIRLSFFYSKKLTKFLCKFRSHIVNIRSVTACSNTKFKDPCNWTRSTMGFSALKASNSLINSLIWLEFELAQNIMSVLVIWKYTDNLIKNEGAILRTTFYPVQVYGKIFQHSMAIISEVDSPIWSEFKRVWDLYACPDYLGQVMRKCVLCHLLPRSLISIFVVCCLDSIICILTLSKVSRV